MTRYIKGKNGRFAGSVGDGKTDVPTAATTPHSATQQEQPPLYDPATEERIRMIELAGGGYGSSTFGDSVDECRRNAHADHTQLEANARIADTTVDQAVKRLRTAGFRIVSEPYTSEDLGLNGRPIITVRARDGVLHISMRDPNQERSWKEFDKAVKKASGPFWSRKPTRVHMNTAVVRLSNSRSDQVRTR